MPHQSKKTPTNVSETLKTGSSGKEVDKILGKKPVVDPVDVLSVCINDQTRRDYLLETTGTLNANTLAPGCYYACVNQWHAG